MIVCRHRQIEITVNHFCLYFTLSLFRHITADWLPQQPNALHCHIIFWLVDVVHFSIFLTMARFYCFFPAPNVTRIFRKKHDISYLSSVHFTWPINKILKRVYSLKSALLTRVETETQRGCVLLLLHLKSAMWFGRSARGIKVRLTPNLSKSDASGWRPTCLTIPENQILMSWGTWSAVNQQVGNETQK